MTGGRTGFGTGDALVQLLDEKGTFICDLPNLPERRLGHTQNGLVTCGGGNFTYSSSTCLTLQNGLWTESYNLTEPRYEHMSWRSLDGVILMGGRPETNFNPPHTSEILTEDGALQTFNMKFLT